jgi:hypothetical protein
MSEGGYKELDLDNPGKASDADAASDIEIVHEGLEAPETEIVDEPVAPVKAKAAEPEPEDEDDDVTVEAPSGERSKKLTRSQRLKAQRDAYAKQLAEAQDRLAQAEQRAKKFEQDANDGAAIGFDLYAKSIDASMQALRRDFDAAFDSGDREKIFEVQQKMATLAAEKQQIERDRRAIPTKPTQQSGSDTPQQTAQTAPSQPARKAPSPAAVEWYERNKTWFNKDPILTAGARIIDQQMVADGFAPDDPDYFEELDKRLKTEFPAKLGGKPAPARQPATNPTIQNRSAPTTTPGKIRVTITQADRDMANHLGISVEDYAREKARAERAAQTTSQYTEIL